MIGECDHTKNRFGGGGNNAQSDKNAAEALAFAERMRPIMAELEALSANKAAIVLNERGVPSVGGARWSSVKIIKVRRRLSGRYAHDKTAEALAFAERMRPILAEMEALSANKGAVILNERGVPTAAGGKWTHMQVLRVRQRLARRQSDKHSLGAGRFELAGAASGHGLLLCDIAGFGHGHRPSWRSHRNAAFLPTR
jgi:hypothetical protein